MNCGTPPVASAARLGKSHCCVTWIRAGYSLSPAGEKLPRASWPYIARVVCKAIDAELLTSGGKKRGPDQTPLKLLKTVIEAADGASSRPPMLLRAVPAMFFCCSRGIQELGLGSPPGQEYASLLRQSLLRVPGYSAVAPPETLLALISVYSKQVKGP